MEFLDILQGKSEAVIALTHQLRDLILTIRPELTEDVYGGQKVRMTSYSIGYKNNVAVVLGAGKDHCKLYLHHTDKIDISGLSLQGKGKHAKHIKLYPEEALPLLRLQEAITQIAEIVHSHHAIAH